MEYRIHKNRLLRRIVSIALVVVMVAAWLPETGVGVHASYSGSCGASGDSVNYCLDSGVLTISGTGKMADSSNTGYEPWTSSLEQGNVTKIVIESGVTYIGAYAFATRISGIENLCTEVVIPDTVTKIGDYAFQGCYSITSVTIPDTTTSLTIGNGAFNQCRGIESIYIPRNISTISIGERSFMYCSRLTSITLPDNLKYIKDGLFYGCGSLTSITIPKGVIGISQDNYGIFGNCDSLESIVVDGDNTKYDSRDNCNAIIKTESNTLISGCGSTVIPNTVEKIGELAFHNCGSLENITIPDSVADIDEKAFYKCDCLESITIPKNMETIGDYAFSGCSKLKTVTIEEDPDDEAELSIGDYAFESCVKLAGMTFPSRVVSIGNYVFKSCNRLKFSNLVFEGCPCDIDSSAFAGITNNKSGTSYAISLVLPSNWTADGLTAYSKSTALWYGGYFNKITVNVTSVTLNKTSTSIKVGETETLTATVKESTATVKTVTWDSSNEDVAIVSTSGLITASSEGTAIITATSRDGTNISASCVVTVWSDATPDTWTYTAGTGSDANKITATCNGECGTAGAHTQDITLSASSTAYTGSAYASASVDETNWTATGLEAVPTIKYVGRDTTSYTETTTAPTNAGKYTAKITLTDSNSVDHTASVDFEITKADLTIDTATISDKTYDGTTAATVMAVTFTGLKNSETLTQDTDYTVSAVYDNADAAGVNAATKATVSVTLLSTDRAANYSVSGTKDVPKTISKATPVYTEPTALTATEGRTLADVTLPTNFTWQDATTTSVGAVGTNTFMVTYTPTDTDNYETINNIEVSITVSAKTAQTLSFVETSVTKMAVKDTDYTQTVTGANTTVTYSSNNTAVATVDSSTGKVTIIKSGTAVIKAVAAEDDDYASADATYTLTVTEDTMAPDVDIKISTNSIKKAFNLITFGLFFKETQTVSISGEDADTGIDKIYYYVSSTILTTETEVRAIAAGSWTEGSSVSLAPDDNYVVYAKVTDKQGNVTYAGSNGLVLDSTAPVITGIESNTTYNTATEFTVTDDNLEKVTANGIELASADGLYTVSADGVAYDIVATDKSGNVTRVTAVKVLTEYTISFDANGGTGVMENMTCTYGEEIALSANAFTAPEGYSFSGWALSSGEAASYTDSEVVKNLATSGTVTLYAVWAENAFKVNVEVEGYGSVPCKANVYLRKGNQIFKEKLDLDLTGTPLTGAVTFAGITPGTYNLVADELVSDDKTITVTKMVIIVNSDETVRVKMPEGNINSILNVVGADTPSVVVKGLDEEAESSHDLIESTKSVEIKMTVEAKEEIAVTGVSSAEEIKTQEAIAQIKENVSGEGTFKFIDIGVTERQWDEDSEGNVTNETSRAVTETANVCEIVVPFELADKEIAVYRSHEGIFQSLINSNDKVDGTFYLDVENNLIHIFANKFSIYAVNATDKAVKKNVSGDASGDASADASGNASGDASADASGNASADASGEASGDASADASGEASGEASADASGEASADASGNASGEASADASGEASADASGDASGEASGDASADASGDVSGEASGEASADASGNASGNASADASGEASADSSGEASGEASREASADASGDAGNKGTPSGDGDNANSDDNRDASEIAAEYIRKATITISKSYKVAQTKNTISIFWGKVKGADGYMVYASYCGGNLKKVKAIPNKNLTKIKIKKLNGKKLNLYKNYKVAVKAYKLVNGKKVIIAKTITAHIVGRKNTKYTNVKGIKLAKNSYTLKKGKSANIKAKAVLVNSKRAQLSDIHAKEFRYMIVNPEIVKVSKNGRITALKKGSTSIYVFAKNGYAKKIKVTVK